MKRFLQSENSRLTDILFFSGLAVYLLHFQCKLLAWTGALRIIGDVGAMVFLDASVFAVAIYLVCRVLQQTRQLPYLLFLAAAVILLLFLWPRLDYAVRCWVINIFLILAARGRAFNRTLTVYFAVYAAGLAAASLGLLFGYTRNNVKWQLYGSGSSLGYISGNNMSRMLLWMAIMAWLLFFRKSLKKTFLCFLPVILVAGFYARCRTVVIMAVLILLAAVITHYRKPWRKWSAAKRKRICIIITLLPFIMLGLSLVLSFVLIPLIPYVRETFLWNFFSRFVQNNIALREYGVSAGGIWVDFLGSVSRNFFGEEIHLLILDNAYVPWLIRNGIIRTVLLLGTLSVSQYRAFRHRDRPLLIAFSAILLYGLMEPAAVQVHYNFAFLYLLAAPFSKAAAIRRGKTGQNGSDKFVTGSE